MQKHVRLWVGLLSFALLSSACADCNPPIEVSKDASNQTVDCVIDPLFDVSSAAPLSIDEIVDGTLCPQGFDDRDYYQVTTGPNDGILEIHLWNDTGFTSVDLRAAILLPDGTTTPMAFSNPNGTGAATDIRGAFGVSPNSQYVIEVSDEGGDDGDAANPYHLEIALSPEPDSHEDNDTAATATADACAGQALTGYLATRGDQDFYQCTVVNKPARLKVSFSAGADLGWQPHLYIGNDQGQALLEIEPIPEADGSYAYETAVAVVRSEVNATDANLSQVFSHTGPVTISVRDVSGELFNFDPSSGAYQISLSVDTGPSSDTEPAERNDGPGTATALSAGSSASGFLASIGDVDWYRVNPGRSDGVLQLDLQMPADGVVANSVDPDRVGVDFQVYDARMSVGSGGSLNATTGCTTGPANALGAPLCDNYNSGADSCAGAHGDQQPRCFPGSYCAEQRFSRLLMQGCDAARVPLAAQLTTAVAIRSDQPVFVAVRFFQSQVYQDRQAYTLQAQAYADPDSREPNDLPPALNREARYSSSSGSIRSCNRANFPIDNLGAYSGLPACEHPTWDCPSSIDGGSTDVCDFTDTTGSCLPWSDNSSVDGGLIGDNPYSSLDCSGAGSGSYTVTGYLSYVGDRDYYSFSLPPGDIEVNVDLQGSGVSSTGIESAVFVSTAGGMKSSFVDSQRANTVSARACTDWIECCDNIYDCDPAEVPCVGGFCAPPEHCYSNTDCPEDYLCIDERCFSDTEDHGVPNRTFGPEGGNCLVARTCEDPNPWTIEITDNGLNDFDLDMQYTLTVRWTCNCPDLCGYCQAPLDYRSCTDSAR